MIVASCNILILGNFLVELRRLSHFSAPRSGLRSCDFIVVPKYLSIENMRNLTHWQRFSVRGAGQCDNRPVQKFVVISFVLPFCL